MSNSLALLLLALPGLQLALACCATPEAASGSASGAAAGGELAGSYVIERIGGRPVVEGSPVSLTLGADGAASGHAGVNRFRGTWACDGEALTFSPLARTKMAGSPALMEQEQRLLAALARVERASVERASVEHGTLVLSTEDGEELVRASRDADRGPLRAQGSRTQRKPV